MAMDFEKLMKQAQQMQEQVERKPVRSTGANAGQARQLCDEVVDCR